ncbi:PAS domain-containing protein [Methylobacterium organophilum]|uniref:PAS domain-containing protein n=1 Tax=Methylobacterium organophilum TaxID=410 RepID=UPI001F1311CA|nr:PAS domain-containing protein [Methylobacterium organophilum]UMY16553.1 PAS domain-containing protein [Methylobacterium organophilum]
MSARSPELPEAVADAGRLAALDGYDILDTPPEPDFDDIVLIASRLCVAPTALISFVAEDRQWFKARVGFEPCETPLAQSVCAHALEQSGILVIPDLAADPRTRANTLVTGPPHLRFYAGAPLVTPEGYGLGSLCILDTHPRPGGLSPAQMTGLEALARQVMVQLALRRSVEARDADLARRSREERELRASAAALAESALRLRLAVEATGVGIFDYDLVTGTLIWDARTREMFGLGPEDPVSYEGAFLPGLHPEDRARTDAAVRAALDPAGSGVFDCEYRTVAADGNVLRWIAARGRLTSVEGRPTRFVGTVRDISAERRAQAEILASEERYRLVTHATNDAIWDWDLVADHVLWNEALLAAYGWDPARIAPTGGWWLDHIHPEDRAGVEADIRAVIAGRAMDWRHEYRFLRADGSYADVFDRGSMVRDPAGRPVRMIGAMLDLTERKRAEAQFRAVFEGANVGIVQLEPRSLKALRVNAKLCAIWAAEPADIVGQSVAKWTPEEDAEERDRLHRRLAAGEIMQETLEKRYRRKDARLIWARVNLVSQWRGDEIQVTAMIEDITEERRAAECQRALIALGDRLRDAGSTAEIAEATAALLGRSLDLDRAGYAFPDGAEATLTVERDWSAGALPSLAGTHASAALPLRLSELARGAVCVLRDAAAELPPARAAAYARAGIGAAIEVPLVRRGALVGVLFAQSAAARDWSSGEVDFARELAERAWGAVARIQAEEQQRLLNRELSHRLKNTLAMAQAIAAQSLRNVTEVETAKKTLVARLIALGKAHDILLDGSSEAADMEALIAGALASHDDGQAGRFRLAGPPIQVGAAAALPLTLMLHELATNAAKYGALSVPEGRVGITWEIVADGAAEPRLNMRWQESGGPPVTPPARTGFGSRLIERGLSGAVGGEVAVDYDAAGVVCRLSGPLSGFLARD